FICSISIIIGLIAGTTVSTVFGKVDFIAVMDASYFHMPQLLYFGRPTFEISAVITMCLVVMVSLVESTGVYFALSDITDKELTKRSEEHTSELQSRFDLVCRLLLEKKNLKSNQNKT